MPKTLAVMGASVIALAAATNGAAAQDSDTMTSDNIVVTGSFIQKSQANQVSPISNYSADDLGAIAAFNPADLINTLTINSGAQNQSDGFNQTFSLGTTNANLRGLGVSSTLTLINGRRQTVSAATTLNGDQFVDLNSLAPSIAVDRVEILKDGATSLYGTDAVAGVVNYITRTDFEGLEVDSNYISTTRDGQGDFQVSALVGKNFNETFHLVGAVSYFNRDLLSAEARRDDFEDRISLSTFGQPGTYLVFPAAGPPTRIVDPACADVAQANDDVILEPTAPTCQFDFGDFFPLVADEERVQAYVHSSLDVSDAFELFAEFSFTDNKIRSTLSPSQPVLFPQIVPDTNPGAAELGIPAGGRALTFIRPLGAGGVPSRNDSDHQTFRAAGGLRGDLNDNWSMELGVTYSRNDFDYLSDSDILVDRFAAALNGVGGPDNNQFFNPAFGAANDPAVIDDFRGTYSWNAQSSLFTVDGHVSGSLLEMPAGDLGVAVGFQYRKDELEYDYNEAAEQDNLFFFVGNDDFSGDQDVYAFFVETDIPVLDWLNLTAAVRYENFGDDADTVDPKIGFLARPIDELSIRGAWGTSFRAPSIFQLAGQFRVPALIVDPLSGRPGTVAQLTTGDPDDPLESQTSDTYNLGATWQSNDLGLTVSVDYWRFEYSNFITPENAAALVNANGADGSFASQVQRDPSTGELLAVTTFYRNAGTLETDGLDVSVAKDWETGRFGGFTATLNMTRVFTYQLADPIIGVVDGLGSRNFTNFGVPTPKTRGNIGLNWVGPEGNHSANIFARYIGGYDDDNTPGNRVDDLTTVDVQYSVRTPSFAGLQEGPTLTLGARNILDKLPPSVVSRSGYDSLTHSPLGRQVYLTVKQRF